MLPPSRLDLGLRDARYVIGLIDGGLDDESSRGVW